MGIDVETRITISLSLALGIIYPSFALMVGEKMAKYWGAGGGVVSGEFLPPSLLRQKYQHKCFQISLQFGEGSEKRNKYSFMSFVEHSHLIPK